MSSASAIPSLISEADIGYIFLDYRQSFLSLVKSLHILTHAHIQEYSPRFRSFGQLSWLSLLYFSPHWHVAHWAHLSRCSHRHRSHLRSCPPRMSLCWRPEGLFHQSPLRSGYVARRLHLAVSWRTASQFHICFSLLSVHLIVSRISSREKTRSLEQSSAGGGEWLGPRRKRGRSMSQLRSKS